MHPVPPQTNTCFSCLSEWLISLRYSFKFSTHFHLSSLLISYKFNSRLCHPSINLIINVMAGAIHAPRQDTVSTVNIISSMFLSFNSNFFIMLQALVWIFMTSSTITTNIFVFTSIKILIKCGNTKYFRRTNIHLSAIYSAPLATSILLELIYRLRRLFSTVVSIISSLCLHLPVIKNPQHLFVPSLLNCFEKSYKICHIRLVCS